MAELAIDINGRNYKVACEDGQEEHVGRLAEYIKTRVEELTARHGQIGDARLLLMVGLLISDELSDAYAELAAANEAAASAGRPAGDDDATATAVEELAARVEAIAARLEGT